MTTRRLFLAKLAGLAGFALLSKAKADYTKPLSLPVVVPRAKVPRGPRPIVKDAPAIDYDRLLYCISAVETQHDDSLIGPSGERSRYQIKESVWRQHNGASAPFLTACRAHWAYFTAVDHVGWLERKLSAPASVQSLAWCWKEGLEAYTRANSNRSGMCNNLESYVRGTYYARRVTNLYNDPTYQHT